MPRILGWCIARRVRLLHSFCSLRLPTEGWIGWVDLAGWLSAKKVRTHIEPPNITHHCTNSAWLESTLFETSGYLAKPTLQYFDILPANLTSAVTVTVFNSRRFKGCTEDELICRGSRCLCRHLFETILYLDLKWPSVITADIQYD